MAWLTTKWEASYDRHPVLVSRDEVTRGIVVMFDGRVVGNKKWSWIGTGTIEGLIEHAGRTVPLQVKVSPPWRCEIMVDGQPLSVTKLK